MMVKFDSCSVSDDPKEIIKEIDCKLVEYSNRHYNNISFLTKKRVPVDVIKDLIHYKRILTYKSCNPDYLSEITVPMIYNYVKLKLNKK